MRPRHGLVRASGALALGCALAAGCDTPPPKGTQIGAIREPDPAPAPPSDLKDLDLAAALAESLRTAGRVTAAGVFEGHAAAIARAERGCPAVWTGALPEEVVDVDLEEDEGLAWLDDCGTAAGDTWHGFTWWQSAATAEAGDRYGAPEIGARSLVAEGRVADAAGAPLWAFDGEAADALGADGSYASSFAGTVSGALVPGIGAGLRAQNNSASDDGGFRAEWSDGRFRVAGTLEVFGGFGPADGRSAEAPELEGLPAWEAGAPRFTSVRYDLTYDRAACADEPRGFVGIRGNEGFWFDVYFLPPYEEDASPAVVQAFPFEEIDDLACDGRGTLFSRNVDLDAHAGDGWTPAVAVDVAAAQASWPVPDPAAFVSTLRQLPVADEPRP